MIVVGARGGWLSLARRWQPTLTPPPPPFFLSLSCQAFDRHLNMILGDVEETVTTPEVDEETEEEIIRVRLCFGRPLLDYLSLIPFAHLPWMYTCLFNLRVWVGGCYCVLVLCVVVYMCVCG